MNELLFHLLYGNTARTILVGALVLVSVLDVISTQKAISSGRGKEANPFVAWFIAKFGVKVLPLLKLPIIGALLVYGIYQENWVLMSLLLVMTGVVANNFRLAYRKTN